MSRFHWHLIFFLPWNTFSWPISSRSHSIFSNIWKLLDESGRSISELSGIISTDKKRIKGRRMRRRRRRRGDLEMFLIFDWEIEWVDSRRLHFYSGRLNRWEKERFIRAFVRWRRRRRSLGFCRFESIKVSAFSFPLGKIFSLLPSSAGQE